MVKEVTVKEVKILKEVKIVKEAKKWALKKTKLRQSLPFRSLLRVAFMHYASDSWLMPSQVIACDVSPVAMLCFCTFPYHSSQNIPKLGFMNCTISSFEFFLWEILFDNLMIATLWTQNKHSPELPLQNWIQHFPFFLTSTSKPATSYQLAYLHCWSNLYTLPTLLTYTTPPSLHEGQYLSLQSYFFSSFSSSSFSFPPSLLTFLAIDHWPLTTNLGQIQMTKCRMNSKKKGATDQ